MWAGGTDSPLTPTWGLPSPSTVTMTPGTPHEETLVSHYSRTPALEAEFGTFGRKRGRRLLEKMRECSDGYLSPVQLDHTQEIVTRLVTKFWISVVLKYYKI